MSGVTRELLKIAFLPGEVGKTYLDAKARNKIELITACEDVMLSRSVFYTFLAGTIIFGVVAAYFAAFPSMILGLGLTVGIVLTGSTACYLYQDAVAYNALSQKDLWDNDPTVKMVNATANFVQRAAQTDNSLERVNEDLATLVKFSQSFPKGTLKGYA